jgi:hypothetical protein
VVQFAAVVLPVLQVCAEGLLLDLQLPAGSAHVVVVALMHALRELREQHIGLLTSSRVAKVLLRLSTKVTTAVCTRQQIGT